MKLQWNILTTMIEPPKDVWMKLVKLSLKKYDHDHDLLSLDNNPLKYPQGSWSCKWTISVSMVLEDPKSPSSFQELPLCADAQSLHEGTFRRRRCNLNGSAENSGKEGKKQPCLEEACCTQKRSDWSCPHNTGKDRAWHIKKNGLRQGIQSRDGWVLPGKHQQP